MNISKEINEINDMQVRLVNKIDALNKYYAKQLENDKKIPGKKNRGKRK